MSRHVSPFATFAPRSERELDVDARSARVVAVSSPWKIAATLVFVGACGAQQQPAVAPSSLDANRIGGLLGAKGEAVGRSVKVSFPRTEVPVEVDGAPMPPFMGLTTWVTFAPAQKAGIEAMIMGDIVCFEDEVSPVMSALLEGGVEVTALHNHFFWDKPKVFFMHVGGEGNTEKMASAVKAALATQKDVRAKGPPTGRSTAKPIPTPSAIDATKLDAILGVKTTAKDGMAKAVMGRQATAACGCTIGKSEGVNTWAAFAGTDDDAMAVGDFAVTEGELQPVLRSLRAANIDVVAIHHHMAGETPRILFLHYSGRGKAGELATTLKRTLDLTAWEGK